MLMDEPFATLDPQIRRSLQAEFRTQVERLGTTVLFVSHDVDEALILGDRLGVMATAGQLAQVGTPLEVLAAPINNQIRASNPPG
jgi:osmoprotectant transport system ATP-binding protein